MANKLLKKKTSELRKLEKDVAKALKAKGKKVAAKVKGLDRAQAIKSIVKTIKAQLKEHKLSWADLPLAKHFEKPAGADSPAEVKVVPAAKPARTVSKPSASRTTKPRGASARTATKSTAKDAPAAGRDESAKLAAGKSQARPKLPPKYRHPENSAQTWSGRGAKPKWLRDYLAAGGELEKIRI